MDLSQYLVETPNQYELITGAVLCLVGWTLYRVALHAIGVALGAGLLGTLALGIDMLFDPEGQYTLYALLGGGVLGAILGIWIIRKIHKFAFFALGVVGGLLAAQMLWPFAMEQYPEQTASEFAGPVFYIAGALLTGVAAILFSGHLIILTASLVGAVLISKNAAPDIASQVFLITLPLAILFQLFLYHLTWGRGKSSEPEPEND